MSLPNDPIKALLRLDLNLLVTLHALLETHSTTRAAEKISRTQSSVSIALKQLRYIFDDPLFIRHGPKLTPTEFGLQLQPTLSRIIYDISNLLESRASFDPLNSDRQITFAIPDIAQSMVTTLIKGLRQSAPQAQFVMSDAPLAKTDYEEGIKLLLEGKLDLLMSFYINEAPKGITLHYLESQTWSIFARADHPISNQPTLEEWTSYDHIQIASGEKGRSPITDTLANTGLKRNIGLKANSFLQALHTVADSDLLLTTMTPLATELGQHLRLREIPLPLEVSAIPFCIMTRNIEYDPLSSWLLEQSLHHLADAGWKIKAEN